MSVTTVPRKYLVARSMRAFLHYLHLDAAMTILILVFFVAAGVANNVGAVRSLQGFPPSVEMPVDAKEAELSARTLTPAMKAALDHVVQRYRVSAEALLPVFEAAQSVGSERQLDPLLLIAVIAIESKFNPFSQSAMGAQGLMQIIPRYHLDKVPNAAAGSPFLDPVTNVRIGAQILQESIRRQGGLMAGLQYYGGALDDEEQVYANKVLAEKLRLQQAARRRDGATG